MIQTIRHPPNIPLPQKSDMPKQRIPLNIAFVTFRMATVSSAIFQRKNFQYYGYLPEAYCYFAISKFFALPFSSDIFWTIFLSLLPLNKIFAQRQKRQICNDNKPGLQTIATITKKVHYQFL